MGRKEIRSGRGGGIYIILPIRLFLVPFGIKMLPVRIIHLMLCFFILGFLFSVAEP
jgi:hypothetical protein